MVIVPEAAPAIIPAGIEKQKPGEPGAAATAPPAGAEDQRQNSDHNHNADNAPQHGGQALGKTGAGIFLIICAVGRTGAHNLRIILLVIPCQQDLEEICDSLVIVAPVKILPKIFVQHGVDLIAVQQGIEPKAIGKPSLVLLNGQQQEHAVVVICGADAPVIEKLIGVLVGIHAVQIIHGYNHNLSALALLFQGAVVVDDHLLRIIGENVGIIRHVKALALIHDG